MPKSSDTPVIRIKIFRSGRNHMVRIPGQFKFATDDVFLRKRGERLIIEPAASHPLLKVLAKLKSLDEDFLPIHDPLFDQAGC